LKQPGRYEDLTNTRTININNPILFVILFGRISYCCWVELERRVPVIYYIKPDMIEIKQKETEIGWTNIMTNNVHIMKID